MGNTVKIGNRIVGDSQPCMVVAEIGINHNGDLDIARQLIGASRLSGCEIVKFQKRSIDVVYTPEELAKPRENPFGTTNGDLKRGLEFGQSDYKAVDEYCELHKILWMASCWDEGSVDFVEAFDPPCYKIASASLTDSKLLKHHAATKKPLILSTGMSTLGEIDKAIEVIGTDNVILMQATSTYPSKSEELNLRAIPALKERYGIPVGYSGHEVGLATSVAAVVLGACMVERHITIDRAMWGSDQAASVEPHGFTKLIRDIRAVEAALGDGNKVRYESEEPILTKLRRVK
jgi:N-acetylneuraminate synthase